VRDSSLTGRDIRNASVTGADVRDRSLTARDFALGQLPSGPQGPVGPRGAAGPKGDPTFAGTVVVQATGDAVANGTRLRDALAKAAALVTSSGRSADDQVLVQLEAGTYQVARQLVLPMQVSLVGPVISAARITVANGPFPDASVLRLAGGDGDGDRFLGHVSFAIFGATTVPADFSVIDIGGNDVEAIELHIGIANATATSSVRGISLTGDGGRFQLHGGRVYVGVPNNAAAFGIRDTTAGGASILLQDVELIAEGSTVASAALRTTAGSLAEVYASRLDGQGGALAIDARGVARVFGSHVSGFGGAIRTDEAGADLTLVGGVYERVGGVIEGAGNMTCLGVYKGFGDVAGLAAQGNCV
jgi:hypothetical protein